MQKGGWKARPSRGPRSWDRLRPWRGSSTDEARCLRELAKRIKEHGKLMSEEKEDVAEAESDDEVRGEDDGKRCQ